LNFKMIKTGSTGNLTQPKFNNLFNSQIFT
jgi:hypothetical protein